MRRPLIFFPVILLGIGVDLISKWWVFGALREDQYWPLLPGVLRIVRARNEGVAFSLLAAHPWLILLVSFVAITVLVVFYFGTWRDASSLQVLALGLLLVGAIGNLIDRLALHYVRDFIDFVPRIPLIGHWAVFNFADICITSGVALFLVSQLISTQRHRDTKTQR